jgi:hypothetical protein
MSASMSTREVYARHTATNGKSYVQAHIVWDADRFFSARATEASYLNADQKAGAPRLAKCEQITQETYQVERKAT